MSAILVDRCSKTYMYITDVCTSMSQSYYEPRDTMRHGERVVGLNKSGRLVYNQVATTEPS